MALRESFTLVLMTFLPLSLDRVNVHVERQEVRGFSSYHACRAAQLEARQAKVKAVCVRERDRTRGGRR